MTHMVYWVPTDAYVDGEGYRVSVVTEGEPGHQPTGTWPYHGRVGETCPYFFGHDLQKARELCYRQNERMGVSREETDKIVAGSVEAQIRDSRTYNRHDGHRPHYRSCEGCRAEGVCHVCGTPVRPKARQLRTIAKWINDHSTLLNLLAITRPIVESTDRKIAGTRLRHPGKGRRGTELIVYPLTGGERDAIGMMRPIFRHNNAETYRTNDEAEAWLAKYIAKLPAATRRKLR